jgi:acyl phosphate:glycerol-3-phosphate acyltransferase
MIQKVGLVAASYLLGSIPFGLIISKLFYNTDIRQFGSGNPGATNVWRTLGKTPGMTTLLLDIIKGILPVIACRRLVPGNLPLTLFCGVASIIGHNWSCFLKMKGGKGVATSIGVFFSLIPLQGTIAIVAFLLVFLTSRRVSVGSIVGAIALFLSTFFIFTEPLLRLVIVLAALMVLIKHIPNMKRLANGTEPKVSFR